jgi:hypothetical protein
MVLGFIIIRHVNNQLSDCYWKESYRCIRNYHSNPILIIDDSSNKEFLKEDIDVVNCTTIYDTEHKGAGELLPYYYFHLLHPFDTAVVLHDSIFIQSPNQFELKDNENIRFIWNFPHEFDSHVIEDIHAFIDALPHSSELLDLYNTKDKWYGCFGVMSIIRWDFIHKLNETHRIFELLLPKIISRVSRCALERIFALLAHYNDSNISSPICDNIHKYMPWGVTYDLYKTGHYGGYPIMKVWTGR